jgi:hypothetical protein
MSNALQLGGPRIIFLFALSGNLLLLKIKPIIPIWQIRQLIYIKINIPIEPKIRAIGPGDPRIANVGHSLESRGTVTLTVREF